MGVMKTVITEGTGPKPKKGQTVTMEYTGYLKDPTQPDGKGYMFDSSVGAEDFVVKIGVGMVIKGWDVAVLEMRLGESATLDITSDYAYGERGFHGHIPERADLIFDVYLKKITK